MPCFNPDMDINPFYLMSILSMFRSDIKLGPDPLKNSSVESNSMLEFFKGLGLGFGCISLSAFAQ